MSREEDLPAVEARAQEAPRLSGQDGDRGWPQGHRRPPGARSQAPVGLTPGATSVAIEPVRRLARMQRLLKRSEFQAAARGRRFHTERMSVQGLRAADDAPARGLRVGLTLTKRVGHATERNRIRRRLRAVAAAAISPFADLPVDVVVIGRREAISAPFDLLVEDLTRALSAVIRPAPSSNATSSGRTARSSSKRGDHA